MGHQPNWDQPPNVKRGHRMVQYLLYKLHCRFHRGFSWLSIPTSPPPLMAFFSQRLALYEPTMAITIRHLTFELLPFCTSVDDYEIDAYTFSAYGTSTDSLLPLRRPKRLVISRSSKKPPKPVLRIAWPDPRNAKEVALFHQKYLASGQDTPSVNDRTFATGSLIKWTIPTSNRISRLAPARLSRHANEG